jgi:hypothetical protein
MRIDTVDLMVRLLPFTGSMAAWGESTAKAPMKGN